MVQPKRLTQLQEPLAQYLPVVVAQEDMPPQVRERVRALLADLARDDLSMALLDLGQLYRTLTAPAQERGEGPAVRRPDALRALLFSGAGPASEWCAGPDPAGACPRATASSVRCAGRWIMAAGWCFRVAPEAEMCPLASLGFVPSPS